MKIYINAVVSAFGDSVYLEARLPNGERIAFKSLRKWDKDARLAIKERLKEDYFYDTDKIKFVLC